MIYIHIPYCHRKCAYCAFYSVANGDHNAYIEALCLEIKARHLFFSNNHWQPKTLYIGGGTPSLLSIKQLKRIVDTLHNWFDLSQLQEATIECNPEDLSKEYLEQLQQLQLFNRISIGVQSFNDNQLKKINRHHTSQQAYEAILNADYVGFKKISIDLIYGLPNQSVSNWKQELYTIEKLNNQLSHPIGHLSCYSLTLESGTILERQVKNGQVTLASDDQQVEYYESLSQWCTSEGYTQYEVSNFAQAEQQSLHNSRYWNRTPYLGLGAAAHSFDGQYRRWNIANAIRYVQSTKNGSTEYEEEKLTLKDAYNEYVMTALRTTAGIEYSQIPQPLLTHLSSTIKPFITCGWISETATHYKPTSTGLLMADRIAADLFT